MRTKPTAGKTEVARSAIVGESGLSHQAAGVAGTILLYSMLTMTYKVIFDRHPQFLRVTVTGENNAENVSRYMQDVVRQCKEQDCYRVLIDECLDGPRLGVDDVFAVASEGAMSAMGVFQAIAYVDEQMGDMSQFAETVAINRGMPVRAFPNTAAAEEWLLSLVEGPEEQKIFQGDDASRSD